VCPVLGQGLLVLRLILRSVAEGQRDANDAPREGSGVCGATMLMKSRDVITLVFFQNLGKCRWLPVTR